MPTLIQDLIEHPGSYDFFLAVRILQAASTGPRVGCAYTPREDSIRFLQLPGFAFVGSSIGEIRWQSKPTLLLRSFGLLGPKGCLPIWMTDFALRQQGLPRPEPREYDLARLDPGHPFGTESPFVAFCYLLQQRMTSLLYRAWELHQLPPTFDTSRVTDSSPSQAAIAWRHPLPRAFLALTGYLALEEAVVAPVPHQVESLPHQPRPTKGAISSAPLSPPSEPEPGTVDSRPRLPSDWLPRYQALWKTVAYNAGLLASAVRNPEGLQAILKSEFGISFSIVEFIERWVTCPEEDRCCLGAPSAHLGLGRLSLVGSRFQDCQMQFRVQAGPLSFDDYLRFLPGRPDHRRLTDIIGIYCGDELGWDLQLVLKRQEVPATRLGLDSKKAPSLLGWTTWLGFRKDSGEKDPDDLILQTQIQMN